jgi:uncharacterized protein YbbC (DUF1343 family)
MRLLGLEVGAVGVGLLLLTSCASGGAAGSAAGRDEKVRPGIEVLLDDSIHLVRGKRIGLLTNQTGVDRAGTSDIDLLARDRRAARAGVRLVTLFSPAHGIRGTEDRENVKSGVDARTGLRINSLYTNATIAPPDSLLRGLDVLVFDLQDIGTRTWTYVGNLVYSLRAAKRAGVRLVVLDRPAPLTGDHVDGPMLDSALANPFEPTPARAGQAYALYAFPLRHGMTMGEMARFYNRELSIDADLAVVPMRGWRRSLWFDQTGLPWRRPSPNLPTLESALVYSALVPFEGSNLSVGRGTEAPFTRFGAPWLDARRTVDQLRDRTVHGVRFDVERFTPRSPGDGKYDGRSIPGVRITVTDRERVHTGRLAAAILWAVARTAGDSLRLEARAFDLRFGDPAGRQALLRGDDPDGVIDRSLAAVHDFTLRARPYLLYR